MGTYGTMALTGQIGPKVLHASCSNKEVLLMKCSS